MEFQKEIFANILKIICDGYESINTFGEEAGLDRTYISKFINQKIEGPPSPGILRKIANNSKGIISYIALLYVCGYLTKYEFNIFTKNL